MIYKDFAIVKVRHLKGYKWQVWYKGCLIRTCKTKKECIERIDNQTI